MYKQRSTKYTHETRSPFKTGGERRCSERVSSTCFTSGTRRVYLVTNPEISHEWGKDRAVFTTSGTYPWSFHIGQPRSQFIWNMLRHLLSAKYFEEMSKPNIMIFNSSIENLTKIVMDSVKNYVRQCTNHVREDKKYIPFFPNRFKLWSRRNTKAYKKKLNGSINTRTTSIFHYATHIFIPSWQVCWCTCRQSSL